MKCERCGKDTRYWLMVNESWAWCLTCVNKHTDTDEAIEKWIQEKADERRKKKFEMGRKSRAM